MLTPVYTAVATAKGGRGGHAETEDGQIKVDLALPKELGGNGKGTNPEQLFACGYGACFGGALDLVARQPHRRIAATPMVQPQGMYEVQRPIERKGPTGH